MKPINFFSFLFSAIIKFSGNVLKRSLNSFSFAASDGGKHIFSIFIISSISFGFAKRSVISIGNSVFGSFIVIVFEKSEFSFFFFFFDF